MSDNTKHTKPKRKYNKKNNEKNKEDETNPIDIETIITEKIIKGEKPSDEELRLYFEKLGFKDGLIPEPDESNMEEEINVEPIPLNIPETEPHKKRCPKGTRKNKYGDCVPINRTESPLNKKETNAEIEQQINKPKRGRPKKGTIKNNPQIDKKNSVPPQTQLVVPLEEPAVKKTEAKTAMNRFLEEKEKLERDNPLEYHDYLYPDLNDPNFNIKIALKKEFRDSQYDGEIRDIEKQANLLCKAKFELSPHQVFIKNFLSYDTPYKGMLLYHGLGTGKTCSSIGVAEEMREYMKRTGLKRQIFVIASPNVQGNFRQQLFDRFVIVD